jgi:hypothetical protein
MSDEPLVVPMHIPRRGRVFMPLSILITIGFLVWMALDWSWLAAVLGVGWTLSIILVWGIVLTNRRVLNGRPVQIVADTEGVRTAMWSVRWDRVDRMWIGATGATRTLNISVADRRSVERPRSVFYSLDAWLNRVFGLPAIKIPEMNIDRPLEDLLAQLEAKAATA